MQMHVHKFFVMCELVCVVINSDVVFNLSPYFVNDIKYSMTLWSTDDNMSSSPSNLICKIFYWRFVYFRNCVSSGLSILCLSVQPGTNMIFSPSCCRRFSAWYPFIVVRSIVNDHQLGLVKAVMRFSSNLSINIMEFFSTW